MKMMNLFKRRFLLSVLLAFLLSLPLAACCSHLCGKKPQTCPPTPCPEEKPVKPKDPLEGSTVDDGLTPEKRIEFISRQIESTVDIFSNRYTTEDGITFSGGTGVVLDDDYILTAYHVIRDTAFLRVTFRQLGDDHLTIEEGLVIPVFVVRVDKDLDVALLQRKYVEDELPEPMPMNPDWEPKNGTLVWHFGKTTSWQHGHVTDSHTDHSSVKGVVEADAKADYGDSGGPFVTEDGKLIGIVLSIKKGEGKTYFIPLGKALEALEYEPPEEEDE